MYSSFLKALNFASLVFEIFLFYGDCEQLSQLSQLSEGHVANWDQSKRLCQLLQSQPQYAANERAQHLFRYCLREAVTEDSLEDVVLQWLTMDKYIASAIYDDNDVACLTTQLFFPIFGNTLLSSTQFIECYCNESCPLTNVAVVLGHRIVRQLKADYFSNATATQQLALSNEQIHEEGLFCQPGKHYCCYMYYQGQRRGGTTYMNVMVAYSYGVPPKHPTAIVRCLLEIYVNRKYQSLEEEQCEIEANLRAEPSGAVASKFEFSECVQKGMEDIELRYILAYTEITMLETIHFLTTRHASVCHKSKFCPKAMGNHPNKSMASLASTIFSLMLPGDALILLFNVFLLLLVFRARNSSAAHQLKRPLVFVANTALVNIAFAITDATTVFRVLNEHVLKPVNASFIDDELELVYCCAGDMTLEMTWSLTARVTPVSASYLTAVLICLRLSIECTSLLSFVAFGLFQIVPLLRPLKSNQLLKHPRRVLVVLWLLSAALYVVVIGIVFWFIIEEKDILEHATFSPSAEDEADYSFIITNPSIGVRHKLKLLRVMCVLEGAVTSALVLIGEIASASLIVVVVYLRRRHHGVLRSTAVITQRTIKTVVVIGAAQTLSFASTIPILMLWLRDELPSKPISQLTEREAYQEGAQQHLKQYLWSRLFLLLEPLLSPVLMLIRFDHLVRELFVAMRGARRSIANRLNRLTSSGRRSTEQPDHHTSADNVNCECKLMEMVEKQNANVD